MDKRIKIGAGVLLAVFALGLAVFAYRGGEGRGGATSGGGDCLFASTSDYPLLKSKVAFD